MGKRLIYITYLLLLLLSVHSAPKTQRDEEDSGQEVLRVTDFFRQGGQPPYGSFYGGVLLTITGYGFDKNSLQNNKVFIGNYPCEVKSATRQQIICQTSSYGSYLPSGQSFPLKVIVGSKSTSPASGKTFTYYPSFTPILRNVFPSTVFGPTKIKIWGDHNIYRIGDGLKVAGESFRILLGNTVCGRSGYPEQYLMVNGNRFLGCTLGNEMLAGKYNISYWVSNGYAYRDSLLRRSNIYRNQTYEMIVLPAIYKISPPSGTGQILNINGTGFTNNMSQVNISVDGRKCEIKSVDSKRIQCRLTERRQGSAALLQTNSNSTQKSGYIGGAGWNYSRYNYEYNNDIRSIRSVISSIIATMTPSFSGYKAELQTGSHVNYQSYLDIYKGYFKAPRTGNYTFKGLADEKFALFMSQYYGSADISSNAVPIIFSNVQTGNTTSHATILTDRVRSQPIFLEQGKYYYMELYHAHFQTFYTYYYGSDGGYMLISADIPNYDLSIPGQVYAIHRFMTKFTPDPEVIEFKQEGARGGTITLSLTRQNSNFQVIYSFSRTINYNASISEFLGAISGCSGFYEYQNYGITGVRQIYDESGNNITDYVEQTGDHSQAYQYLWRVSINYKRSQQHKNQQFDIQYNIIGSEYFSQITTQQFSPLIQGSFQAKLGGLTLSYIDSSNRTVSQFPFNVDPLFIERAIQRINGLQNVKVSFAGDPNYGGNWTVFYNNYLGEPPYLQFDTTNMTGGADGTSPTIQMITLQNYKTDISVRVIDQSFLYSASSAPKVIVTINGLTAVCLQECGYKYNETSPKVTQIVFNQATPIVNFTLSIPSGYNLNISTIRIVEKYSQTNCFIPVYLSLPSFHCFLESNDDFSPKIPSGPLQFQVFVPGVGYLQKPLNLSLRYNMVITSRNPANGSQYGGYNITILGRGFNFKKISEINISLCNQTCQVLEVLNSKIVFQAPSCNISGLIPLFIQSGSESKIENFTFDQPPPTQIPIKIYSIFPNSLNPTIKRPLKIYGENFGNISANLKIILSRLDGRKTYFLKVLRLDDTYMEVGFPGSLNGMYKLIIRKTQNSSVVLSKAFNQDADIIKIGVFIYSVWPLRGSIYGGTKLTIRGENFSPEMLDNLINIGQRTNTFCEIQSLNETEISCRTPTQPSSYLNFSQKVYVTTKITEDSICMDSIHGCSFAYDDNYPNIFPKLFNMSKDYYNLTAENVTVSTNNQTLWENGFSVIIKNSVTKKQLNVTGPFYLVNETVLKFGLPLVQSGLYQVFIRTSNGNSDVLYFKRGLSLTVNSQRMTQKGGIIIVKGIGLPSSVDTQIFKLRYTSFGYHTKIKVTIQQTSPNVTKLLIKTPAFETSSQTGNLYIQGPFNSVVLSISFVNKSSITNSVTYTPTSAGNVSFVLTNTSQVSRIRIVSTLKSSVFFEIKNFTYLSSKIYFSQVLTSGAYKLWVNSISLPQKGWYELSTQVNITRGNLTIPNIIQLGINGGLIQLPNFASQIGNTTHIIINGQVASFYEARNNNSYFYVPPFTPTLMDLTTDEDDQGEEDEDDDNDEETTIYNASSTILSTPQGKIRNIINLLNRFRYSFAYFSDMNVINSQLSSRPFDKDRTSKYQSMNTICSAGINITASNVGIKLKKIYLQLPPDTRNLFKNLSIQASVDGVNWTKVVQIPKGNIKQKYVFKAVDFKPNSTGARFNTSQIFKALRLVDTTGLSKCSVDIISFHGQMHIMTPNNNLTTTNNTTNGTNITSNSTSSILPTSYGPYNLTISDGYNLQNIVNIASFSQSATPFITNIEPKTGNYFGGYNLTIYGTNLQGNASVFIDSIPCPVLFNNKSIIICLVQERPQGIEQQSFNVLVNGSFSIITTNRFNYVLRWSDEKTWGMSFKPIDGDLIHVPKGQVLWVDESTPKLLGIVVEGKIVFSDEFPMTITTDFIIVRGGQFVAGTAQKPYNNYLVFKLTGSERTPRQPIYGTKVIGCQSCKFSMHAKGLANFRWASLTRTVLPDEQIISLDVPVPNSFASALMGKTVVVTSSDLNDERQVMTIGDTTSGGLYLTQRFQYKHISKLVNSKNISAEVGLLESNIIIEGVDSFPNENFGAKLMFRGEQNQDDSFFKVSNVQITKCGQPYVYNQHCITVLSSGMSSNSYIKNSSIHDTYSRGIHFSNHIVDFVVSGNLIVNTSGHSIEFQHVQSSCLIKRNLIINPISSWVITQKDATPAALHFFGTMNILQDNHIAGGQYYGIWYDLMNTNRNNICGWGSNLNSKSSTNYVHSFKYIGVYIDKISAYQQTCSVSYTQNDPRKQEVIFKQYVFYKNNIGLSIQQSNFLTVTDCTFVQNYLHFYSYFSNIYSDGSRLVNSSFSGQLDNSTLLSSQTFVQLPCSKIFNITRVNFSDINTESVILRSCSPLYYYYNSNDEIFVDQIRYFNAKGKIVQSMHERLFIIYDRDGTFSNLMSTINPNGRRLYTQQASSVTIVADFPHFNDPSCFNPSSNISNFTWPGLLACNSSVKVRKMQFFYYSQYWYGYPIHLALLSNFTASNSSLSWTNFYYKTNYMQIPLIMDRYYQIYLERSFYTDFSYIQARMVGVYQSGDGSVIFRHTYQKSRQLFEVKVIENNGSLSNPQTNLQLGSALNFSTCKMGDYYHDNNQRSFGFCYIDDNLTEIKTVRIQPIFCRYQCPSSEPQEIISGGCNAQQQSMFRVWSNSSMWPNGTLPQDGNNVTIPKEWKVILDVNPPKMNIFIIKGTLIIPNDLNQALIDANAIWVQGSLKAGNSSIPYDKNLTIKITGDMNNMPFTVDTAEQGNKLIVVTGLLSLYGKAPSTVWTRLISTAQAGSTTISVIRNLGWNIGDKLVIGPSFSDSSQTEYVTITDISSNLIYFTPPLNFTHFGAPSVTTTQKGQQVDARSVVGHLTRNIKIMSGGSQSWGYRILTYGYSECNAPKFGQLKLSGVQLVNGGQPYPVVNKPRPALHIKRLTQGNSKPQISSCSFHQCNSRCIIIDNSVGVKLNNNIFATATNMHIEIVGSVRAFSMTYNAMIDARAGISPINKVACFEWKAEVYKSSTGNSLISNNVCQGSKGAGFSRYFEACSRKRDSCYEKNTVGSAQIGFLLFGQSQCSNIQYIAAHNCKVGVLGNPRSVQVNYNNVTIIDSDVGISLRTISKTVQQTAYINNSYINPVERLSCPQCYNRNCSNSVGVYMFVATQENSWGYLQSTIPYSAALANQFTQASYDAKAFIMNSNFSNFRGRYSSLNCTNNYILMAPPSASQLIGSTHFYNTSCSNCEISSIIKFLDPDYSEVGPLRPCGQYPCTGKDNYYVEDHTGTLFGSILNVPQTTQISKTLIPGRNSLSNYLANATRPSNLSQNGSSTNSSCMYLQQSSGYVCENQQFYVLEFESIGNDYDSRVTWPVYISNFNMSYWADTYYNYNSYNWNNSNSTNQTTQPNNTVNPNNNTNYNDTNSTSNETTPYETPTPQPLWLSKLNTYKQWKYSQITGMPLYSRINRFNGLILANQTYNITFRSTPPRDIRFQFQKRKLPQQLSVNSSLDYAIIKIYYPVPNSIRIQVNNQIIEPITHLENNLEDPLLNLTHICGANKYYFKHRTIDFVINSNSSCRPRLTITNSIQLTAKFSMSIDDFYRMDGKTQFIDRMAALLGLNDRSRIKVVGVYRGSVVIESFVEDNSNIAEQNATNATYNQEANDIQQLSQVIDNLYSSGALESALGAAGFGSVIIFNSNARLYDDPYIAPTATTEQQMITIPVVNINGTQVNIAIIAGGAGGAVVILILLGCLIYLKRKNKIENEIKEFEMQKSDMKRLARKQQAINNSSLVIVDLD